LIDQKEEVLPKPTSFFQLHLEKYPMTSSTSCLDEQEIDERCRKRDPTSLDGLVPSALEGALRRHPLFKDLL
jgi:hypothetical protein